MCVTLDKCCCCFSLKCGIYTICVLNGLNLLAGIMTGIWLGAFWNLLLFGSSLACLIWEKSILARQIHFYSWALLLISVVIFLISLGIDGANILEWVCE